MMHVLNTFAFREVQSMETWEILTKMFIDKLLKDELDLRDFVSGVIAFKAVSIKSNDLYELIINYFSYKKYSYKDLEDIKSHTRVIKLFDT